MRAFFAPALMLLKSFPMYVGFLFVAVLFMIPQLLGLYLFASGSKVGTIATAMLLATLPAAYLLASFQTWTNMGLVGLRNAVERIASGDLTRGRRNIRESADTEAGKLWNSLHGMNESLVEIVNQVRSSADSTVAMARDIAAGNANLSERTQEQAMALQRTAAGMEELAATVKLNAGNCTRANKLAG